MRKMAKAQSLLSKSACPACSSPGLELRLDCHSGIECQKVAVCEGCNRTFAANVTEFNRGVEALLPDLVCRGCGTKGAQYSMVCEIPTLTCDPQVTCTSCGDPFLEAGL